MHGVFQWVQGFLIWTVTGPCDYTTNPNQRLKELMIREYEDHGPGVNRNILAAWAAETNVGPRKKMSTRFRRDSEDVPCHYNITDSVTLRILKKVYSVPSLMTEDHDEYSRIVSNMSETLLNARICDFTERNKCDLELIPEIKEIMRNSYNSEELKYVWIKFQDASGKKVRINYERYVELTNKGAKYVYYEHMGAYWLSRYGSKDFRHQIDTLWAEVTPLYLQLHAYVRRQLFLKYGEDIVTKNGPIPAHLLSSLMAENWQGISHITAPFPDKMLPDVSEAMRKQGYNATRIFRLAENFFISLNMSAMPEEFWKNSIFEKPEDVNMLCHSSAWNFYDGKDFRIKMCTSINMANVLIAHHEMGHVQYFLQYDHQPLIFKDGANAGFHEAIGDTISLSVSTPSYLKAIGLLDQSFNDNETSLNSLFFNALDRIPLLPFAYMLEKWRWGVFEGSIPPDGYNCKWWSLAEKYEGIEPPIDRSEEDFDPGAIYHIVASREYMNYFVADILQFQFHKALCIEAGQYDSLDPKSKPLHECSIHGSAKAGNLFKSMLKLGSSVPWQDALEQMTGQREMDSSALLEYFEPLMKWLEVENAKTNEFIGWKPSKRTCTGKTEKLMEAASHN